MRPLLRISSIAVAALAAAVLAPLASAAEKTTRGLRFPSLTPDGKTVVFAWRGDIWRAPVAGGGATRLTIHEAQDTKPKVSPDGKWILFGSKRTGNYDVFVMPIEGGEPKQVTWHSGADIGTDWSPDGKRILFLSGRDAQPFGMDLFEVAVDGGTPRRITRDGGRDGAYSPDGKWVVYSRGFQTINQDDYKGSADFDLYVVDLEGGVPRQLTKTEVNELNPAFGPDGKTVWCLAETKGVYNVHSVPLEGGTPKPFTAWTDESARRASMAWDRTTYAFEKDGRLYTLDLSKEGSKPVEIKISVESDVRNSGFDVRTITGGGEHVCVSPDGDRIAVALRGDLWVLPAAGGDATRVTSGPATDDWPRFSPDGKRLLYFSDAKGNDDVYVLDLATKESKPLTTNAADDAFGAWAPDGKRIVYTSSRSGNKDLWVLDLESGEERQLTKDPRDDDDPVFSADGQWIAFDSGRSGTQAIWVVPSGGSDAQARRVTSGAGFFQVPSFSPDGTMIAYEEVDQASGSSGGIWVTKASGGPSVQVSRDGQGACFSPRGDWLYFQAERNGTKDVYRVRAPQSIEVGERVPFLGRVQVDRRREFADLFDEAWGKLKDGFYDPNMHGVDWNALKTKYRPLAIDAEIKDEFYNVVSQMLGELKASHLGIFPGGEDEAEPEGAAPTGYLGLELAGVAAEGGGRKVTFVQPRGPADEAGLRVGDVVKAVGGTQLRPDTDLDRVLSGTAGKEVPVAYGKGDGSGDKTTPVKAVGGAQLAQLKYQLWTDKCRKTVGEATKGEVAYLHLSQMDQPNLQRFNAALTEFNGNRRIKALVLDVRNNGGGNIHQQLLDALSNKPFISFQPRGVPRQVQPALRWGKPVVVLINERSFSDAEVFPYGFKQLGLGKVVGVPTAGGVIGTNDVTLSDGSRFRIPRVGWYGLNNENLEHLGVKPDVLVEETPEDRLAGRDPQLAKAIEVILSEVHPPKPADAAKAEKPAEPKKPDGDKPEESPKPTVPTPDLPKPTPPKAPETAKPPEAPKTEAPKPEAPKPEAPKPEAPKPEAPKPEAPKPEAPKPAEAPDAPKPADAPKATEGAPKVTEGAPAAVVSAQPELDNPLYDAKVGEWVKVRITTRAGAEQTLLVTVVEVTDGEVEVETTDAGGAEGGPSRRRREVRAKELSFGPLERQGDVRKESLSIGGKDLACRVVTLKNRRGGIEERWYSNEVPGSGLVRRTVDGRVVAEVVEWGAEPRK